jgi:hypothetical protein
MAKNKDVLVKKVYQDFYENAYKNIELKPVVLQTFTPTTFVPSVKPNHFREVDIDIVYTAMRDDVLKIKRTNEKYVNMYKEIVGKAPNRGFLNKLYKPILKEDGKETILKISEQKATESKKMTAGDIIGMFKTKIFDTYINNPQNEKYNKAEEERLEAEKQKFIDFHNKTKGQLYQVHLRTTKTYIGYLYTDGIQTERFTIHKASGVVVEDGIKIIENNTIRKKRKDSKKPLFQAEFGFIVDVYY